MPQSTSYSPPPTQSLSVVCAPWSSSIAHPPPQPTDSNSSASYSNSGSKLSTFVKFEVDKPQKAHQRENEASKLETLRVVNYLPAVFLTIVGVLHGIFGTPSRSSCTPFDMRGTWLWANTLYGMSIITFYATCVCFIPYVQQSSAGSVRAKLLTCCVISIPLFSLFRIDLEDLKPGESFCLTNSSIFAGQCEKIDATAPFWKNWTEMCNLDPTRAKFAWKSYKSSISDFKFQRIVDAFDAFDASVSPIPGNPPDWVDLNKTELFCSTWIAPCDADCNIVLPAQSMLEIPIRTRKKYCENFIPAYLYAKDAETAMIMGAPCSGLQASLRDLVFVGNARISYETDSRTFWKVLQQASESTKGNCTQRAVDVDLAQRKVRSQRADEWYARLIAALVVMYVLHLPVAVLLGSKKLQPAKTYAFASRHTTRSVFVCAMMLALSVSSIALSTTERLVVFGDFPSFVYGIAAIALLNYFWFVDRLFLFRRFAVVKPNEVDTRTSSKVRGNTLSKFIKALMLYRREYKKYFSMGGVYYSIKCVLGELFEILVQGTAIIRSSNDTDAVLLIVLAVLVSLNCIMAPLNCFLGSISSAIIVDSAFDILYLIVNIYRTISRKDKLELSDAISVAYPLVAIADRLRSYARYSIAKKVEKQHGVKNPLRRRMRNVYAQGAASQRVFVICASALTFFASGFFFVFLVVVIKTTIAHSKCMRKVGTCAWRGAFPRLYFKNAGIFGDSACNEGHVKTIDLSSCEKSEVALSWEMFSSLEEVKGLPSLSQSFVSLATNPNASLKVLNVSRIAEDGVLNLRGAQMERLPAVLKNAFMQHRDGANVFKLDVSENVLNEAAIAEILSAFGCPTEDGSIASICGFDTIDVSFNPIANIPQSLFVKENFPQLRVLNTSQTQIPPTESVRYNLQRFSFENGTLPTQIGLLTRLTLLALETKNLKGTIPSQIGNLEGLVGINLAHNDLEGSLPSQLGRLKKLSYLDLAGNEKLGNGSALPTELGFVCNLVTLNVAKCSFEGQIPSQLGQLTMLHIANLYENHFSGHIPPELGGIPRLGSLVLAQNALSGTIPTQLGSLRTLFNLQLWGNLLTGPIPPELGAATRLRDLRLSYNTLTGTIPSQLGYLSKLEIMFLNDNGGLNGTLPSQLGKLTALRSLYVRRNQLVGTIPSELSSAARLTVFSIENNRISGSIPTELGKLTHLKGLFLSFNELKGSIPSQIGLMEELQYMYLNNQSKDFDSTVPAEVHALEPLPLRDLRV